MGICALYDILRRQTGTGVAGLAADNLFRLYHNKS
jgi:hypothetical protein